MPSIQNAAFVLLCGQSKVSSTSSPDSESPWELTANHMIHHPDSLSFCNRTYQHWELNRWRELFYDSIPSVAISTGRNLSLKSSSISFLSNVQSMSDMYTTSWKCITLFLDSRNDGLQYLKTIVSGVGSDLIGIRENDCGLSQLIRLHFSSSYAGLK